jgi:hypothetical protein
MSDEAAENKGGTRMPPYTSFSTFLTFIEELKVNGIPPQIDNSVLKRFSGGVRTQLLSALKYLALLSDDRKPAGLLPQLVESFGNEAEFKKALATVINSQYAFLGHMDLKTATPTMFADAFRNTFGGQEAVLAKCRTFYMQAAKYVGIELGQRLTAGTSGARPAAGAAKATRRKAAKRAREDTATGTGTNGPNGHFTPSTRQQSGMMEKLLEKFPKFDPKWDAATQAKWFDGFQRLMANAEEAKKENGG